MEETRNNACYTYKSHDGTARWPPLWRVTRASQMQLRQRHVATRVWKVLAILTKRIARALIVPIGISRKGFGRTADAISTKDKPLQYLYFITYFECFHQHRKGIREIKTRRGMKQTRHQQSSKSTFSHGNSKKPAALRFPPERTVTWLSSHWGCHYKKRSDTIQIRLIVSVRENLAKIRRVIVSGSVRIKKSNCEKRVTVISWFS